MTDQPADPPANITDAEQAVMEVLWREQGALGAADVADRIEGRGWSLQTVKTLLSRLVDKAVVEAEPQGRRFLYRPKVMREDFVAGESTRLVDRLFGGRAVSLFAHLAEQEKLSDTDIDEIEALLRELRR